jgi:undecaprenyl phosphate-alpha-L-ara4N flippase subunit ArnE
VKSDYTGLTSLLLALCIATNVGRELCFKLAADQTARSGAEATRFFGRVAFWAGLLVGATQLVAWVAVLQRAPLAIAYPLMASAYAGVPIASVLLFGERLTRSQVFGAALVAAGVTCVAVAGM